MSPSHAPDQIMSAKNPSADDIASKEAALCKTSEVEAQQGDLDPRMDARLRRKIDLYIIPVFGILYLLCFLDRGNIGNANVASPSISQSLGMTPTQYGACVSVFYATYVVSEPLWSILTKIVTPKLLLVWGALTLGTAWTKEYGHLVAIRVLLGWFEGGLFPCLAVYLFMNFRREEIARRISYIYLCSGISGAVGGLIATGLIRIESGNMVGWQYLYVVEGVISLAAAPLVWFTVPNHLKDAWFLNAEEKQGAIVRATVLATENQHNDEFSWREIRSGFLDWKAYTSGVTQFASCFTLYGVSTFMPAIIRGMGYSNVNAQLLTVPVYLTAAVWYLFIARMSERYACRGPFLIGCFCIVLVGYLILALVKNEGVRYFGLFLMASGLYTNPGLNISWVAGNTAGHYKRSTTFGINQLMGNSAGASIGSIFLSSLAPRYTRSLWIGFAITCVGLAAIVFNMLVYKMLNQRREKLCAEGAEKQPLRGDKCPHFRYFF